MTRMKGFPNHLGRFGLVCAFASAVLVTSATAVREVHAANETRCLDYRCKDDGSNKCSELTELGCDYCNAINERCGISGL